MDRHKYHTYTLKKDEVARKKKQTRYVNLALLIVFYRQNNLWFYVYTTYGAKKTHHECVLRWATSNVIVISIESSMHFMEKQVKKYLRRSSNSPRQLNGIFFLFFSFSLHRRSIKPYMASTESSKKNNIPFVSFALTFDSFSIRIEHSLIRIHDLTNDSNLFDSV